MIDTVVEAACESGCERAIIAGVVRSERAENVLEEPRYGGPAAGLAAALRMVETDWIMLLSCDLPGAFRLCRMLNGRFEAEGPGRDGLVAINENRIQWLSGIYRRSAVEAALGRLGDPGGASIRDLLGGLELKEVPDREGLTRDIDTPEDLEEAIARKESP